MAGRNVIAMRVVANSIATLVYSAVPGQPVPPELGDTERAELRAVISDGRTRSYLDGDVLKVIAPIMGDRGDHALAAAIVHLSADYVQSSVRRNMRLAGLVAVSVLAVGLLASAILARRVTGPVSRLTAAAAALESNAFESESLIEVAQRRDDLGHLARVFNRMALEVHAREQRLKQQVQQLRIEIDDAKKGRQVAEITETDYFHQLCVRARGLRARFEDPKGGPSSAGAL